jgi:hypothetical protein
MIQLLSIDPNMKPKQATYLDLYNFCNTYYEDDGTLKPIQIITEPFVGGFCVDIQSGRDMCILVTTKTLLRQVKVRPDHLRLDATYKVNWHGFPVVIPTLYDFSGHGHPLGVLLLKTRKSRLSGTLSQS